MNVLVLTRTIQRQRASGIFVPENSAQREEEGGDEGLLVGLGPSAGVGLWPSAPGPIIDPNSGEEIGYSADGHRPNIGDQVMFARYAGKSFVGADGRVYRLMKDKEILGVRDAEVATAVKAA